MYGLAKNPQVFDKLSAEVREVASTLSADEYISFDKAMKLPYL